VRRQYKKDNLTVTEMFDKFERTVRLMAVEKEHSILSEMSFGCFDIKILFKPNQV
jgi:hypothetical protein